MSPSGLAQRYLAAIQNDLKDIQHSSTSLLASTEVSTKEDEFTSSVEVLDLNSFASNNIQSRNGSNSPSILRPRRDSSGSCPSRDSVSSEEEPTIMMEEFRQTQIQWRNFRNSMKLKAEEASLSERNLKLNQEVPVAAATATSLSKDVKVTARQNRSSNSRTPIHTTQQEEQERGSDACPPTEIMNNVSDQWKQKHINQWKKTYVPSSTSKNNMSNGKWKQQINLIKGTLDRSVVATSDSDAFTRAENDSLDPKTYPQHILDGGLQSSSTEPLAPLTSTNPWAVNLRSVKNIKVPFDPNTADPKTPSSMESKGLNPTQVATTVSTTDDHTSKGILSSLDDNGVMPVKQRLKDWNKMSQLSHSTEKLESTSVAYSIQQEEIELKPLSLEKTQNQKSSVSLSSNILSRSVHSPTKTFRKATFWIKTSLDSTDVIESPSHTRETSIPTKKTQKNIKSPSEKHSLINKPTSNSLIMISKIKNPEEEGSIKRKEQKCVKSVSDTGASDTRVRDIRSLFESKLTDDHLTRNEAVRKWKNDRSFSPKGRVDGETNKTKQSKRNDENVVLIKAPKTLMLIKDVKKPLYSRVDQDKERRVSSPYTYGYRPTDTPTQGCTPSRITNGVSSLKAAFESSENMNSFQGTLSLNKENPIDVRLTSQNDVDERESDFDAEIVGIGESRSSHRDKIISCQSVSFQSLRSKFDGSGPSLIVTSNPSGGGSTFNSLCVENHQSFGDTATSSVSKIRPIPQKANNDIGKQSAFMSYQQRVNLHQNVNSSVEGNDIPWDDRTHNDIPWHDRELQEEKDKYMHEISILTDKRVIDMSYGIEYLDYSLDDDDGDGVTLSPRPSDVSSLSIPSCIQSLDAVTSDDDTGAIESINEKQSSVMGPSEASSSQMSESAKPLIYSALGTMGRKFPMKSSSDTSQSYSVQYTGLLRSLPSPSEEEAILKDDDDKSFFMLQKTSESQDSNELNYHFEEELDLLPGFEWKNDLFAINSVKSSTSGDDFRWPEFPDCTYSGCNLLNHPSSSENFNGAIRTDPRKATPESSGSKSSRSIASPKPDQRKTISSERIKSPSLPVVRELKVELAATKTKLSSSSDLGNINPPDPSKDSTESRVSTYRRFNIQKVRAFQQFRRSGSYN